jgi:carboxymethylenebutenolidase
MQKLQHKTASGKAISAALALPPGDAKAPGLLLIHEWWGLNWEMETIAESFARDGYLALAVDLFDGATTDRPERAQRLMDEMDPRHAHEVLAAWLKWLRAHGRSNGKVGTLGYCLGGAWSLNASTANPVDATVIYHGKVDKKAAELKSLKGKVLGHFATRETYIPPESVKVFEQEMRAAGKPAIVHFYDAAHAFTRPRGPNFHPPSTELARRRTLDFLGQELG